MRVILGGGVWGGGGGVGVRLVILICKCQLWQTCISQIISIHRAPSSTKAEPDSDLCHCVVCIFPVHAAFFLPSHGALTEEMVKQFQHRRLRHYICSATGNCSLNVLPVLMYVKKDKREKYV